MPAARRHRHGLQSTAMPRPLLRLILALALVLAVPLQGWAAAAAGACMALGHHDAPPAHAHDGGADADHQHAHDPDQPAESTAHCPPCTACCASAVIAPSSMLLPLEERAEVLNVAAPPFFTGIRRTVVDRPPLAL